MREAIGGQKKPAALVAGAPGYDEFEFQPAGGRKWAKNLKVEFRMNQKKVVVGRADSCDIKLDKMSATPQDLKAISREQCSIEIDDFGTMIIRDHSGNGTLVNETLIKAGETLKCPDMMPLNIGDAVTFGGHASECKYVLAITTQRPTLSRIESAKLRGKEEADIMTDAVKQARILAGDFGLAARESHRAWALWANLETLVKDMSSVRCLVAFAMSGSPHQCAHAAAALHALATDPEGINHVLNAGGVSALSTLAAVNDEFIDGLEICKEEALMGLRAIIISSAQGRERIARDGALRVLVRIARNREDPMCYLAEEAVREYEDIEDREIEKKQERTDERIRSGRPGSSSSRPHTAKSSVSWVSDAVSNTDTDLFTMGNSRPASAIVYPELGLGVSMVGARHDFERANAFRPQSAIAKANTYSRPDSANPFQVSDCGMFSGLEGAEGPRTSQRPASAATVLTQQQYLREAAKRPLMFKREYLDAHNDGPLQRADAASRPGSCNSQDHKQRKYWAEEVKSTSRHNVQDILRHDKQSKENQASRLAQGRDHYMPACPRGPPTGSSAKTFAELNEELGRSVELKSDGLYRSYRNPGGMPRDIDELQLIKDVSHTLNRDVGALFRGEDLSINVGIEEVDGEFSSRPSTHRDQPPPPTQPPPPLALQPTSLQQDQEVMSESVKESAKGAREEEDERYFEDYDEDPQWEQAESSYLGAEGSNGSNIKLQRPGSAIPKVRGAARSATTQHFDVEGVRQPASRARPFSAGGVFNKSMSASSESTPSMSNHFELNHQEFALENPSGSSIPAGVTVPKNMRSPPEGSRPKSADQESLSRNGLSFDKENAGFSSASPASSMRRHSAGSHLQGGTQRHLGSAAIQKSSNWSNLSSISNASDTATSSSMQPRLPFDVAYTGGERSNFARPRTPGGLMPIFERAESNLNESPLHLDASLEKSQSPSSAIDVMFMSPYLHDAPGVYVWSRQCACISTSLQICARLCVCADLASDFCVHGRVCLPVLISVLSPANT